MIPCLAAPNATWDHHDSDFITSTTASVLFLFFQLGSHPEKWWRPFYYDGLNVWILHLRSGEWKMIQLRKREINEEIMWTEHARTVKVSYLFSEDGVLSGQFVTVNTRWKYRHQKIEDRTRTSETHQCDRWCVSVSWTWSSVWWMQKCNQIKKKKRKRLH